MYNNDSQIFSSQIITTELSYGNRDFIVQGSGDYFGMNYNLFEKIGKEIKDLAINMKLEMRP